MAAIHLPPGNRARRRWCRAERRCASGASFGIGFRRDEPGLHAQSSPHRVHVEDRQAGGQQRTQCAGIEGYHDRMRVHGFDGAPFRSCSLDSISAHPPRPCRRGPGSTRHDADRHHLARHCRSNCPAGTPHCATRLGEHRSSIVRIGIIGARFSRTLRRRNQNRQIRRCPLSDLTARLQSSDWPIPRGHRARPGSRAPSRAWAVVLTRRDSSTQEQRSGWSQTGVRLPHPAP